jgi:DNA mismatch endonuclease (patch repair protein)
VSSGKISVETDPETSARMKRIRRRDTSAELLVRKWLWRHGVRFTANNRDLPGSPDLANRSRHWAVFVHGCFWHGHGGCKRATVPKRNVEFWTRKIEDNRQRDARKEKSLRSMGYTVITVWECEAEQLDTAWRYRRALLKLLPRPPRRAVK